VNDPDRAITWPAGIEDDLPEHLWAPLGLSVDDELLSPSATGGLVSLAFIWEALRRARWVWCLTTALGLVIGCGLYLRYPPAYHAQASVLLVDGVGQDPEVEVLTDQSIAQSQPVAASVVQELGLKQSAASFQAAYTVTVVTPTVLTLNVGAPTSAEAVQRATALASSFLQYRAKYEQTQEQEAATQLNQGYDAAELSLATIDTEIAKLPTSNLTPAQSTQLGKLQAQAGDQQQNMLYATSTEASNASATESMVSGSYVLNPATPLAQSKAKGAALYVAGGLFGGLAIGMAIVIIAALLSDRLRRRDDVAAALGAPVRLSVGRLRAPSRWRLARRGRRASRDRDMKRLIAYLHGAVPGSPRGPASLAVVAVDEAHTVAPAIAALALIRAREGKEVVVADLSAGLALARLLGVKEPGVHPVKHDGMRLQVAVPRRDDVAPVGPLHAADAPALWTQPDGAVDAACSSADLLLTLITLDPAMGGAHLASWASEAVVVVTAGRSCAEEVRSAGEMIRLAGTRLDSAVLIGADRSDTSLGRLAPDRAPADAAAERKPVDPQRGADGAPDGDADLGNFQP